MRRRTGDGDPSARGRGSSTRYRGPSTKGRDPWRYRWAVLGIATFTQAAAGFFVQGIGALGIPLQRALDLSTAQLGLLVSAAQLVPLVGLLVAGELLDRYNERWVVGIGACVVAVGLGVGSAAPGYVSLLCVLLVVGAGYSTVQPGGSKSVASWFDTSRRGFAMGVRQAGLPLGAALASAVLPLLAEAHGWRATLVAGAVAALLGAGVFMGCYRRPPSVPSAPTVPPVPSALATSSVSPASLSTRLGVRLRLLREPAMVKIMLSGATLISVQYAVGVLTVLHLHEAASVGAGTAALVLVAAQGAGVVGRIGLAVRSDRSRSGRHGTIALCMVAVIAGMAVLMSPLGRSPALACGVLVWLGFFGYGWYGPWVAYVTESAPAGRTGFTLGLAMSVNQVAIVLMPPALGLLRDLTGSFTVVWGLLSALTATALVATTVPDRRRRRHGPPGAGGPPDTAEVRSAAAPAAPHRPV
ncbi:MFS transporter [Streptomyces flavofungini]|uniref:MFS transporter n=1 Tax=Streptomyces flavofungini TaxID=68200 RepID=A0ABS0X203_9ACTN|nr:MFS transporter [Streptomyces flavofungini]MBJ3807061.1 MFS transporter [Streptomyces flavofungini]GHC75236.1 MFS transporter [Streptomyces flavofungini]